MKNTITGTAPGLQTEPTMRTDCMLLSKCVYTSVYSCLVVLLADSICCLELKTSEEAFH